MRLEGIQIGDIVEFDRGRPPAPNEPLEPSSLQPELHTTIRG